MNLNEDYRQIIVLNHHDLDWVGSTQTGVERRMLDSIGAEAAKSTTIVRYQPGSKFEAHTHEFGEEILVLEGAFSDENGDYPAGTYMMNPPGSSHSPRSDYGCVLFVKIGHLGADQQQREVVDTRTAQWHQGMVPGLTVMPLMRQGLGSTLVRWAPKTYFNQHRHFGAERRSAWVTR